MTRGFSILEILIALAIIASTLLAVSLLILGFPFVLTSTHMHSDALIHAINPLSRDMARGMIGFSQIQSHESIQDNFTLSYESEEFADGSAKRLQSLVSWKNEWSEDRSINLSALVTDYEHAANYNCSPLLLGEWGKPDTSEVLSSLPPIAAITATRARIALTASTTVENDAPSLFVFDATTKERVGSFDISTSSKVGYIALASSRDYLYALTAHACSGGTSCASLDVFSLLDNPITRSYSFPLPPARSIRYQNGKLYIGLRSLSSGPEFLIYDVSDSGRPMRIGSAEIGDTVTTIATNSSYAYVGTADNSAAGNKALMTYRVLEPTEYMQPVARARQAGAGISQHLYLSGSLILLGRSALANSKELFLFEQDNISREVAARDVDTSITGLLARGSDAFVLTRDHLTRWNVSDKTNPFLDARILTFQNAMRGTAITCGGSHIYVAANANGEGHIYMLSGS